MTGGTITTGLLIIGDLWSTGHVDLHGGTIHSLSFFRMDPNGTMDVEEGVLIVDGNDVGYELTAAEGLLQYIDDGWITAYDGAGAFKLDYSEPNGFPATLSACMPVSGYDLDESGGTDLDDLAIFLNIWLNNNPYICGGDFDDNGTIDFLDFAALMSVLGSP